MKTNTAIGANTIPADTVKYINYKVRMTSMNVGLSYQEEEDLKQHLYLCVIRARENFEADRKASLETYLHMEVDGKTKNFLRDRQANKRVKVVLTLDAPVEDENGEGDEEDSATGVDLVADENDRSREESDLRHDVAYALSRIKDERVRTICKLIMRGVSYVDIAKIVGVPEWSIRQRILPSLVPLFKDALNS